MCVIMGYHSHQKMNGDYIGLSTSAASTGFVRDSSGFDAGSKVSLNIDTQAEPIFPRTDVHHPLRT